MLTKEIDNHLIDIGYESFAKSSFHHEGIEKCFQKRFQDEYGTKYFIDINKWKPIQHPSTKEWFGPEYEYCVQLYKKETHDAVDILFHSSWTIEDVERHIETLFQTGLYDYYEGR